MVTIWGYWMTDLSHSREKDKINPVVFYTSAGLILLFSLTTILFRDFSALWIGRTLDWVLQNLRLVLSTGGNALYCLCGLYRLSAFWFGEARARTIQPGIQPAELGGDAVCCRDRYRPDVLLRSRTGNAVYAAAGRRGDRRSRPRVRRWSGRCFTTA